MALKQRSEMVRKHDPAALANPFEFAVGIMFLLVSLSTALLLAERGTNIPEQGIFALPLAVLWVWVASIGAGGAFLVAGLLIGSTRPWGRAVEKAGLWLALSSWGTAAVCYIFLTPADVFGWGQFVAVCIGCILRLYAIHRVESVVAAIAAREAGER